MMVYYTYPAEKAVNSNTKEVLTKRYTNDVVFQTRGTVSLPASRVSIQQTYR